MQAAMRAMLHQNNFTHWVTLNFHQQYSTATAKLRLQKWFMDLNSRLFSSNSMNDTPTKEIFFFFAFPENTMKSEPHFHLLVFIRQDRKEYFERLAASFWKRIVPSGTAHIMPINSTEQDMAKVIDYATKHCNKAYSHDEFLTSTMLKDGRFQSFANSTTHECIV
jgi:hypothetical protein